MLTNMSQAEKQLALMEGVIKDKRILSLGFQAGRPEKPEVREVDSKATEATASSSTMNKTELEIPHIPAPAELSVLSPVSPSSVCVADEIEDDVEALDVTEWFKKYGISVLHEETVALPLLTVFRSCWLQGSGYGDFLVGEGDLGLEYDEWVPNNVVPVEDSTGASYSYTRNFTFEHPRTTMLFIGPKNAPAKQIQHLYCGGRSPVLQSWAPRQVIATNVSKFSGFPFADTFKVVQYWTMTSVGDGRTLLRLGVKLHFITQTMFKGQIVKGTESELVKQAKRWVSYCNDRCVSKQLSIQRAPSVLLMDTSLTTTISPPLAAGIAPARIITPDASSEFFKTLSTYTLVFFICCFGVMLLIQWRVNHRATSQLVDIAAKLDKLELLLTSLRSASSI
jgi:hypothetical protein